MINHFNEYMRRQFFKEDEGDMLTFSDFMNNDLCQFDFNSNIGKTMPHILEEILLFIFGHQIKMRVPVKHGNMH